MDNPFAETNCAGIIIGLLDLQPGMKVLDAGSGPGRPAIPTAQTISGHNLLGWIFARDEHGCIDAQGSGNRQVR